MPPQHGQDHVSVPLRFAFLLLDSLQAHSYGGTMAIRSFELVTCQPPNRKRTSCLSNFNKVRVPRLIHSTLSHLPTPRQSLHHQKRIPCVASTLFPPQWWHQGWSKESTSKEKRHALVRRRGRLLRQCDIVVDVPLVSAHWPRPCNGAEVEAIENPQVLSRILKAAGVTGQLGNPLLSGGWKETRGSPFVISSG